MTSLYSISAKETLLGMSSNNIAHYRHSKHDYSMLDALVKSIINDLFTEDVQTDARQLRQPSRQMPLLSFQSSHNHSDVSEGDVENSDGNEKEEEEDADKEDDESLLREQNWLHKCTGKRRIRGIFGIKNFAQRCLHMTNFIAVMMTNISKNFKDLMAEEEEPNQTPQGTAGRIAWSNFEYREGPVRYTGFFDFINKILMHYWGCDGIRDTPFSFSRLATYIAFFARKMVISSGFTFRLNLLTSFKVFAEAFYTYMTIIRHMSVPSSEYCELMGIDERSFASLHMEFLTAIDFQFTLSSRVELHQCQSHFPKMPSDKKLSISRRTTPVTTTHA